MHVGELSNARGQFAVGRWDHQCAGSHGHPAAGGNNFSNLASSFSRPPHTEDWLMSSHVVDFLALCSTDSRHTESRGQALLWPDGAGGPLPRHPVGRDARTHTHWKDDVLPGFALTLCFVVVSRISYACLVVLLCVFRACEVQGEEVVMAVCLVLGWCNVMFFARGFEMLGPYVIMIQKVWTKLQPSRLSHTHTYAGMPVGHRGHQQQVAPLGPHSFIDHTCIYIDTKLTITQK